MYLYPGSLKFNVCIGLDEVYCAGHEVKERLILIVPGAPESTVSSVVRFLFCPPPGKMCLMLPWYLVHAFLLRLRASLWMGPPTVKAFDGGAPIRGAFVIFQEYTAVQSVRIISCERSTVE